jgi:ABC-2 type transport system permease protein
LFAVFRPAVLLNSKRVAPYLLAVLFTANSILWWGWSVAATYGWTTNGDYNIVRNLTGFSFILGLPIFNAVIMGDPVIKDFRLGVDPLIFSKPISRASYLLGKFFGNFFVLVCCQSAFVVTMVVLQWVPLARLVVGPFRVLPFFKHFFFFVVVSHLLLAMVYFSVGTLTRSVKVVYGLAAAFYPVYIASQVILIQLLGRDWRGILDPMLPKVFQLPADKWDDPAFVNAIVIEYSTEFILNRAIVIIASVTCLIFLCRRFSIAPRTSAQSNAFSLLNLSTTAEMVYFDREAIAAPSWLPDTAASPVRQAPYVALPKVSAAGSSFRASLRKLIAATKLELKLLLSEKSLIILVPLTMLLSFLALPFSAEFGASSPSVAFASATAQGTLIFLLGIAAFYIGEAMYRDRELRVEPLLWCSPVSNSVFLVSKMAATVLFVLAMVVLVGLTAMLTQALRGRGPIDIWPYVITYGVVLLPSLLFMTAACMALNALLRERYLSYAVIIALVAGLFYLYSQGHNHWLYNPVLYGLWTQADFEHAAEALPRLIALRAYTFALALLFGFLAHLFFARPTTRFRRVSRLFGG